MIKQPMLAETVEDIYQLNYPVIGTPKVDGIRGLKVDGEVVARSFLPIVNNHAREMLKQILPEGADGEIFTGFDFQKCSSAIMSQDGEPEFKFCMFDYVIDGDCALPENRCP